MALTVLVATSGTAQADDPNDAEALIGKGIALRKEGKDAEALTFFRKAFAAVPSTRARAQIGLDEQALGMWIDAEKDLSAALADSNDAWVKRYRGPLESALAVVQGRLGSLDIAVNVPAEVFVDGVSVGRIPGPVLRVIAGTRSVEVQAAGYHSGSRSVTVPGGGVARETFELGKKESPESPASPKFDPPDGATTHGSVGFNAPPQPAGSSQRTLGWVFVASGAGVLVGGVVAQIVREVTVSNYNSSQCPGADVRPQPEDCTSRISTANTWQTLAIVGVATGAALALTGSVLLVTAPHSGTGTAMRVGCSPRVGSVESFTHLGGGIDCSLAF